jgi:hypothetical protein
MTSALSSVPVVGDAARNTGLGGGEQAQSQGGGNGGGAASDAKSNSDQPASELQLAPGDQVKPEDSDAEVAKKLSAIVDPALDRIKPLLKMMNDVTSLFFFHTQGI